MTHKNEMIRWANSPDGEKVWTRIASSNEWYRESAPLWMANRLYVVDDIWAELRKAIKDGKTIQFNKKSIGAYSCKPHWVDWNSHGEVFSASPCDYRIKPEPEYEWQWIRYDDVSQNKHILTNYFYTDISEIISSYKDWVKFEPSIRVRHE